MSKLEMLLFRDRKVQEIADAMFDGEAAAWVVATGGEPDMERLGHLAEEVEALRRGIADSTLRLGWTSPTEQDVHAVRHFVALIREGVARAALVEPAWRVYHVTANPRALYALCSILPWLAGEATRLAWCDGAPIEEVRLSLDEAAAFFERGGNVAGFVPTAEDLARVRRLREIAAANGGEELAERHRLARELWARLPQDDVSAGVRQRVAG